MTVIYQGRNDRVNQTLALASEDDCTRRVVFFVYNGRSESLPAEKLCVVNTFDS